MKSETPDIDQRQYVRIPKKIRIEISPLTFPLQDQSEGTCTSKDISVTGVRITGTSPLEPGDVISMKLTIMGWQSFKKPFSRIMDIATEPPLTAIGQVIWCRKNSESSEYDIGVKFINIYKDDYKALMTYLKDLENQLKD